MGEEERKEYTFNPDFVAGFISGLFDGNSVEDNRVPKGTKEWAKAILLKRTKEIFEGNGLNTHHGEVINKSGLQDSDLPVTGVTFSDINGQRYFAPLDVELSNDQLPIDYELFDPAEYI